MSQVAYTALPMMNLVNMPTTLNVSDYDSSATTSSMSSPNMFSASSPETPDSFISPMCTINQEDLSFPLAMCIGQPYLEILEQPVDKFRFRYKSEMMGTHGSILAKSSDKSRKRVYPTVRLQNHIGEAILRCSLYTAHQNEYMRTPHTHRLVVRVGNDDKDDPHEMRVNAANNYTAVFQGMGIIHTAKKHIAEELLKKKRTLKLERLRQKNYNITSLSTKDETEIRAEAEAEAKRMNLNSVTLCFEAFTEGPGGIIKPICQPVFSTPINNMKSALTGELKICRIDKHSSSCLGGEEVFILVEKVGKKNIKIKFFELDEEDNEIWCDYGRFSELDVHHQYAIVFRTPPYRDTEITDNASVYLQLYRPTDGDCSEPIQFSYKPSERLGRKRQRMSVTDSYNRHISRDNELVQNLLNLDVSGNNPSFSGIATTSTSLEALLRDPRMSSDEFQDFLTRLSDSGNLQDYNDALPQGPQSLNRQMYRGTSDLVTDSACNRTQQSSGKFSTVPSRIEHSSDTGCASKECPDEDLLARQIVEEMKRNASLKRPIFTERILKMFHQRSQHGNFALHAAILHKQEVLLKYMLDVLSREPQHSLLNCVNSSNQTPLHTAAAGSPLSVKWLLNAGADPDRQDDNGDTPLHIAVKHNANLCVDELLTQSNYRSEMKPDLNKKNATGWTPLHVGVLHKNLGAIKSLIAAGANVNEGDTNGRTVLHFAADEDDEEIAAYLVKHTNIDINKKDRNENTAFERARVAARRGRASKLLCQILDNTKVEGQMEMAGNSGLDLSNIKKEPDDSDDELHIDEDDDDDDDEDEDEEEEDDDDTDKESNSTDVKSPMSVDVEKKHIMTLLQGVTKSPERRTKSPEITEVKEEMFASPVSEIPDENGLFNAETLSQLCDILDSSGTWQDLAELLGYTFLIASIKDNPSPSRLLFNYADVDGNVTVKEIRNFLDVLDEHKAVELVDLMLAGQES